MATKLTDPLLESMDKQIRQQAQEIIKLCDELRTAEDEMIRLAKELTATDANYGLVLKRENAALCRCIEANERIAKLEQDLTNAHALSEHFRYESLRWESRQRGTCDAIRIIAEVLQDK